MHRSRVTQQLLVGGTTVFWHAVRRKIRPQATRCAQELLGLCRVTVRSLRSTSTTRDRRVQLGESALHILGIRHHDTDFRCNKYYEQRQMPPRRKPRPVVPPRGAPPTTGSECFSDFVDPDSGSLAVAVNLQPFAVAPGDSVTSSWTHAVTPNSVQPLPVKRFIASVSPGVWDISYQVSYGNGRFRGAQTTHRVVTHPVDLRSFRYFGLDRVRDFIALANGPPRCLSQFTFEVTPPSLEGLSGLIEYLRENNDIRAKYTLTVEMSFVNRRMVSQYASNSAGRGQGAFPGLDPSNLSTYGASGVFVVGITDIVPPGLGLVSVAPSTMVNSDACWLAKAARNLEADLGSPPFELPNHPTLPYKHSPGNPAAWWGSEIRPQPGPDAQRDPRGQGGQAPFPHPAPQPLLAETIPVTTTQIAPNANFTLPRAARPAQHSPVPVHRLVLGIAPGDWQITLTDSVGARPLGTVRTAAVDVQAWRFWGFTTEPALATSAVSHLELTTPWAPSGFAEVSVRNASAAPAPVLVNAPLIGFYDDGALRGIALTNVAALPTDALQNVFWKSANHVLREYQTYATVSQPLIDANIGNPLFPTPTFWPLSVYELDIDPNRGEPRLPTMPAIASPAPPPSHPGTPSPTGPITPVNPPPQQPPAPVAPPVSRPAAPVPVAPPASHPSAPTPAPPTSQPAAPVPAAPPVSNPAAPAPVAPVAPVAPPKQDAAPPAAKPPTDPNPATQRGNQTLNTIAAIAVILLSTIGGAIYGATGALAGFLLSLVSAIVFRVYSGLPFLL